MEASSLQRICSLHNPWSRSLFRLRCGKNPTRVSAASLHGTWLLILEAFRNMHHCPALQVFGQTLIVPPLPSSAATIVLALHILEGKPCMQHRRHEAMLLLDKSVLSAYAAACMSIAHHDQPLLVQGILRPWEAPIAWGRIVSPRP